MQARDHVARSLLCGQPADAALAEWLRGRPSAGARDRRLIRSAIFAEIRWHGWVRCIDDPPARLAIALALDGLPELAQQINPDLAPMPPPSADLSDLSHWLTALMPGRAFPPEDLVPSWIWEEIPEDGRPHFRIRFLESLQRRPPLWLRARFGRLREALEALRKAGVEACEHPRVANAIRVDGACSRAILAPLLHQYVEIQDFASQQIGLFCAPASGERWWDMCAGGGGKALHLLDLTQDHAFVYCTDLRSEPLRDLARRARAAGFRNWQARQADATSPISGFKDRFQGILIDAPCSGTGTWSRNPDGRFRVKREDLPRYTRIQNSLLQAATEHLAQSGRIIYSVCSLTRTETEDVTERFCRESGFHVLRTLRIDPADGPGIGMWAAELRRRSSGRAS